MSRIGNTPIQIPQGVTVLKENNSIRVQGAKGMLTVLVAYGINVEIDGDTLIVEKKSKDTKMQNLHGTTRALIANAVYGVSKLWEKKLKLVGVGYRAQGQGREITLTVGYSHPVKITAPEGIEFNVKGDIITVKGIDKQMVGEIAAKVRQVRKPEPYKGKGIRYIDEIVRRKPGKAAKGAGVGV